jgi:cytochrome bd-type quinol oxidase subunit 2
MTRSLQLNLVLSGLVMTPEKVLDRVAVGAAVGTVVLGVQALFQLAQLFGEPSLWASVLTAVLAGGAIGLWAVRQGVRARKPWALAAYESLLWTLAIVSVCSVFWVLTLAGRTANEEMRGAQGLARVVLPLAAIPWLAALGYELWRVRRADVRALLGRSDAKAG